MPEDISVSDAIEKIRSGEMTGKDLPKELLRETILILRGKGQEQNVIAKFLGYSCRQVRRFIKDVRKANRFVYTEDTHTEHIGWFVMNAQTQIDFLTRTYNNSGCPEKDRILACIGAWKIAKGLTESLQSLGVLPSSERLISLSAIYAEKGRDSFNGAKTNALPPGMEGFEDLAPIDRDAILRRVVNLVTEETARLKAAMLNRTAQELPPAGL